MKRFIKGLGLSLAMSLAFLSTSPTSFASGFADTSIRQELYNFGIDTLGLNMEDHELHQDIILKQSVLSEVQSLRAKMWDENVPYVRYGSSQTNTRLRDVARSYGYTSKEAYVNALKWSKDLEIISIQRVLEQQITGISHTRPDGSDNSSIVTHHNVFSQGEIISAGYSNDMSPSYTFNRWSFAKSAYRAGKSEYQCLVEANGVFNKNNGHLHIILNPSYNYIGYAETISPKSKWSYGLASFGRQNPYNSEEVTGIVTKKPENTSKPKDNNDKKDNNVEKPTDQKKHTDNESKKPNTNPDDKKSEPTNYKAMLLESIENARIEIDSANYILENYPKTIAKVRGKLIALIKETEQIIEESEALLKSMN